MSEDSPISLSSQVVSLEEQRNTLRKRCQELENTIQSKKEIIAKIKTELKIEKFKSSLFYNIIVNNTDIKLPEVYQELEDGIHLQNFENGQIPVFVREYLGEEKDIKCHTIAVKKTKVAGKLFRSVKQAVEEKPSEQEERIKKGEEKMDELVQKHFDVSETDVVKNIEKMIEEIGKQRAFPKLLSSIREERITLIGKMPLDDYVKMVNVHIKKIEAILVKKKYEQKKISSTVSKSLSPLEQRLTFYGQYYLSDIESSDDIQKFKASLRVTADHPKKYIPFSAVDLYKKFYKYSMALFPLKENLAKTLHNPFGFSNLVYLPWEKSSEEDPYTFYVLEEIKENNRCWKMECRLDDFSKGLAQNIKTHCITLFRRIYFDVFNDNIYREDYKDKAIILERDCEQLLVNIFDLSKHKTFCNLLRRIVVKFCSIHQTNLDKFNYTADDRMVKRHFQEEEDDPEEVIISLRRIFDNITNEEIEKIVAEKSLEK